MVAETENWRDRERQREAKRDDFERLGFDDGQTVRQTDGQWRDGNLILELLLQLKILCKFVKKISINHHLRE